jgi:hypothetical protein
MKLDVEKYIETLAQPLPGETHSFEPSQIESSIPLPLLPPSPPDDGSDSHSIHPPTHPPTHTHTRTHPFL